MCTRLVEDPSPVKGLRCLRDAGHDGEHRFESHAARYAEAVLPSMERELSELRVRLSESVERERRQTRTAVAYGKALRQIVREGPVCFECPDGGERHAVFRTTRWPGFTLLLCAEHAAEEAASNRKAESKGCGKAPEIEPVELPAHVQLALDALAEAAANGGKS